MKIFTLKSLKLFDKVVVTKKAKEKGDNFHTEMINSVWKSWYNLKRTGKRWQFSTEVINIDL